MTPAPRSRNGYNPGRPFSFGRMLSRPSLRGSPCAHPAAISHQPLSCCPTDRPPRALLTSRDRSATTMQKVTTARHVLGESKTRSRSSCFGWVNTPEPSALPFNIFLQSLSRDRTAQRTCIWGCSLAAVWRMSVRASPPHLAPVTMPSSRLVLYTGTRTVSRARSRRISFIPSRQAHSTCLFGLDAQLHF